MQLPYVAKTMFYDILLCIGKVHFLNKSKFLWWDSQVGAVLCHLKSFEDQSSFSHFWPSKSCSLGFGKRSWLALELIPLQWPVIVRCQQFKTCLKYNAYSRISHSISYCLLWDLNSILFIPIFNSASYTPLKYGFLEISPVNPIYATVLEFTSGQHFLPWE